MQGEEGDTQGMEGAWRMLGGHTWLNCLRREKCRRKQCSISKKVLKHQKDSLQVLMSSNTSKDTSHWGQTLNTLPLILTVSF